MKNKTLKTMLIILAAVLLCGALAFCGWKIYDAKSHSAPVISDGQSEKITLGKFELNFNKEHGSFSVSKNGEALLVNAVCEYKFGEDIISSADYDNYEIKTHKNDVSVTMTKNGLPQLVQKFTFEADKEYFLTKAEISSDGGVSTNYIAPIVVRNGGVINANDKWSNFLEVPFDNDAWIKFTTKTLSESGTAYEVGAFFTPDNGAGLIIGSVNHDLWKSAIEMNGKSGRIEELKVYCGVTYARADNQPHNPVSGETVSSPVYMVGTYDKWKDGMNEFADVNLMYQPRKKAVIDYVPVGWNSWGSVQQNLNYETAVGISDYVKENFQNIWESEDAPVYINLDSYWDMLSDEELKMFVDHCKQNGQKAGVYIAPYIIWGDDDWQKENYVPGTNDTVTYYDLRLKKNDGTLYGKNIDGCYPMDVTHPAARLHIKSIADRFKAAGFEYIKFDYLVHSSFEGDFYNHEIQTGIQAYNYAMEYLAQLFDGMFINYAMSPTFPYQYTDGRRLACDSYYKINETEYTLNTLTYGFWENKFYNSDPDHLLVWGKDGKADENEAIARITSGAICSSF